MELPSYKNTIPMNRPNYAYDKTISTCNGNYTSSKEKQTRVLKDLEIDFE
jgi:hypothetical protein